MLVGFLVWQLYHHWTFFVVVLRLLFGIEWVEPTRSRLDFEIVPKSSKKASDD